MLPQVARLEAPSFLVHGLSLDDTVAGEPEVLSVLSAFSHFRVSEVAAVVVLRLYNL